MFGGTQQQQQHQVLLRVYICDKSSLHQTNFIWVGNVLT